MIYGVVNVKNLISVRLAISMRKLCQNMSYGEFKKFLMSECSMLKAKHLALVLLKLCNDFMNDVLLQIIEIF